MTTQTSISSDQTITEPKILREGEAVAFKIIVPGVNSTLASPTMTFYKQNSGADVSSTYFTGSMSVFGLDTIITKTTQNLKKGDWTMSVFAVVDGQTQCVSTTHIIVKRANES